MTTRYLRNTNGTGTLCPCRGSEAKYQCLKERGKLCGLIVCIYDSKRKCNFFITRLCIYKHATPQILSRHSNTNNNNKVPHILNPWKWIIIRHYRVSRDTFASIWHNYIFVIISLADCNVYKLRIDTVNKIIYLQLWTIEKYLHPSSWFRTSINAELHGIFLILILAHALKLYRHMWLSYWTLFSIKSQIKTCIETTMNTFS